MVAKQENKDVQEFNRRSMTYEDSWEQRVFFDRLHKAVLDLVESQVVHPKNIVDVGCGAGRLLPDVPMGPVPYKPEESAGHLREGHGDDCHCQSIACSSIWYGKKEC